MTDRHTQLTQEATATVLRREVLAQDVVALTLSLPDGMTWTWEPGAHIDVEVPDGAHRQYSLCGPAGAASELTIAVLREVGGRGGSEFLHALEPGAQLCVRGPRNHFPLVAAARYRFVAGGIGITPIVAMIRQVAASGGTWDLLYGGRNRCSMAFLEELTAHGPRVTVVPQDEHGLMPVRDWLGTGAPGEAVYCCGPTGLLDAVESHCVSWPAGSMHVERFTPRPVGAPQRDEPFEVELVRTGKTVVVEPGTSILDAVKRVGVQILSSCREGTCGTCETPVLEGVPEHRDSVLDEEEQAANDYVMICVSRSLTSRLVLDL